MPHKLEKRISFKEAHIFPCKYRNLCNIPHWHGEHELIWVERGCATLTAYGILFTLQEGQSAFLHSGEIHSITSRDGAVVAVAKTDEAYFRHLMGGKRLRSPLLAGDYGVGVFFSELFRELEENDEYRGVVADCLATTLMARILRGEATETLHAESGSVTEKYKALLDRIGRDYAYITFADAAKHMHFSEPYFSKYFYNQTGMTFTRYLNVIKISSAVERILQGQESITEISQSCGFNTIRNFNRVFRELTGFTPSTLPPDYRFVHHLREYADSGFDPTLNGTEVVR